MIRVVAEHGPWELARDVSVEDQIAFDALSDDVQQLAAKVLALHWESCYEQCTRCRGRSDKKAVFYCRSCRADMTTEVRPIGGAKT